MINLKELTRHSLYFEIKKTSNGFIADIYKEGHKYSGKISEGNVLISKWGYGNTIEEAKKDLLNKISDKLLVFSAYGKNREEINLN